MAEDADSVYGEECWAVETSKDGIREEVWPGDEHLGLPVVLPGGEEGRLLRFEHHDDPARWTYALEFRGMRE